MCGIVGIANLSSKTNENLQCIKYATDCLSKRGPDDSGVFTYDQLAFGHRRLSVIDVSSNASQPLTDTSGRYTIIYNGEFYNYKKHRKELLEKGVELKSNSDTEVLLNLYKLYGKDCLHKVNGFFSLAIFDKEENSLFVARDRFGIKPLYWYSDGTQFIFASELKSLLKFNIKRDLDYVSLITYTHLSYIPAPYSIFENIWKMEPGAYFFIHLNTSNTEIKSEKWYTLNYTKKNTTAINTKLSYTRATNTLIELLEKSVENRLVSDVPLGTFLSGGIDSSAITALASKHSSNLNTFTISFKDQPHYDESKYAELVANKFNTNHKIFELNSNLMLEHLDDLLDYIDEPFADSSSLAYYVLCNKTRNHVKVALSGDGSDELFAGYNKYRAEYRVYNAGLSEKFIKYFYPVFNLLPQSRHSHLGNKIRQIVRFGEGINLNNQDRYWRWAGFFNKNQLFAMFNKEIIAKFSYQVNQRIHEHTSAIDQKSDLASILFSDIYMTLQNDMMVKADRMSMANSLEVRVPFLDHHLIEFTQSLPIDYKIDSKRQKKILVDAVHKILPAELFNRRKKGFEVPLINWFKNELKGMIINDLVNDKMIENQGIYDVNEVKKLKKKLFSSNPGDSAVQIWTILVFQNWAKSYLN